MNYIKRYNLLLDLYSLLSSFPFEGTLLAIRIEDIAMSFLNDSNKENDLKLLLRIAYDLSYIDEEIFFLINRFFQENQI